MSFTIFKAGLADFELALPLFEAYRRHFTGREDAAGSARFLQERLRASDSAIFLATNRAAGAGFLQLYPLYSSWYARRLWFLSDLFVAEAARGFSIGQKLVKAACEHARRTGATGLIVEVPLAEPRLKRFYEALDFCKDAEFELYRRRFEPSSLEPGP